jgi:lysozyme
MRLLALFALLSIAACGGPEPVAVSTTGPLRFGDSDPVAWTGSGPHAHPVHGIDLSRYQSEIDWARVRAAGVSFAFLKATEGSDRVDPTFEENWEAARQAGVARGAYHFFYWCGPAESQARWFIRNVPRDRGALPPVLDLEWNPFSPTCTRRPPPAEVRRQARIFIDIVARHYGQRPVIYTTRDFWHENDVERLGEEIWIRSTARHVDEIYPGASWTFWQYTATGIVPGVDGPVDLNAFNGSHGDWARWVSARSH